MLKGVKILSHQLKKISTPIGVKYTLYPIN